MSSSAVLISLSIATAATECQSTERLDRQTAINTCARVPWRPTTIVLYAKYNHCSQGRPADPIAPLSLAAVSLNRVIKTLCYRCSWLLRRTSSTDRRARCTARVRFRSPFCSSTLVVAGRRSHLRVTEESSACPPCSAAASAQSRCCVVSSLCIVRKSCTIQSRACCSPKRQRNTARATLDVDVSRLLRVVAGLTAMSRTHSLARCAQIKRCSVVSDPAASSHPAYRLDFVPSNQ